MVLSCTSIECSGQTVKANETLFEIHDLSRAWVQGFLSEAYVPFVRLGQSVRVRLVSEPNGCSWARSSAAARSSARKAEPSLCGLNSMSHTKGLQHNMLAQLDVAVGSSEPTLAGAEDRPSLGRHPAICLH